MKTYIITAAITGSRYLGTVEAETEEDARGKAEELASAASLTLCHQCAGKIEDPEIGEIFVEAEG